MIAASIVPDVSTQRIKRAADAAPPAIRVASPASGARIDTFTPEIEIEYDDEGTGVAVVSFRAMINGRDHSAAFEHHSRGATGKIASSNPLPLGENTLTIELADRAGNVGRAEATFINAGGGWVSAVADPGVGPRRHVELVLDASGSMLDKLLDNTRMAVAKGAVKSLIKALPEDTPLGLRVFKGCDNIASLIPIARIDKAGYAATVDKIEPSGGTPIVASLLQSFQALAKLQDVERLSVLVTDGGESCNGAVKDAVEQAKELSIRVIVISFDIREQTVNEQLRRLAEMTGGAYFNAQDGAELQAALERSVLRLGFGVHDAQGKKVAEGEVNGARLMLPLGTYQLRFDVSSARVVQEVTVAPLGEVSVRLRQSGSTIAVSVEPGK
jgi:hypothetical protein